MSGGNETKSSGDKGKPSGKSARKRKAAPEAGKARPQRRKSAQPADPQPDRSQEVPELVTAAPAPLVDPAAGAVPSENSPVIAAPPLAAAGAVSYQTIADAYRDYARQSLDQAASFFEQLAGVRSLDQAFELQRDYARQVCEGFITESQKIRDLHNELARQRLSTWEDLLGRFGNPR